LNCRSGAAALRLRARRFAKEPPLVTRRDDELGKPDEIDLEIVRLAKLRAADFSSFNSSGNFSPVPLKTRWLLASNSMSENLKLFRPLVGRRYLSHEVRKHPHPRALSMPKKGDLPFRKAKRAEVAGPLAADGLTRTVSIMDGFMHAGTALADLALKERLRRYDLVYPMLFCYRHAVETGLSPHSPDDAIICSVDPAIQLT
jgi:hypothetical protein